MFFVESDLLTRRELEGFIDTFIFCLNINKDLQTNKVSIQDRFISFVFFVADCWFDHLIEFDTLIWQQFSLTDEDSYVTFMKWAHVNALCKKAMTFIDDDATGA